MTFENTNRQDESTYRDPFQLRVRARVVCAPEDLKYVTGAS